LPTAALLVLTLHISVRRVLENRKTTRNSS